MTANEMKNRFNLKGQGALFRGRTFNDREVSRFLSLAQLEFTQTRFDEFKNRTQRGYETSDMRRAELAGLVTGHSQFTVAGNDFMVGTAKNGAYLTPDLDATPGATDLYGYWVRIPDECLDVVSYRCNVTDGTNVARNVMVMSIDPSLYNSLIYDDLKNPSSDTVWVLQAGSYTRAGQDDTNAFEQASPTILEESTKYGDTRVVTSASSTDLTGLRGVSANDNTTVVTIKTERMLNVIFGKGWPVKELTLDYIKIPPEIVVNTRLPASQVSSEISSAYHDQIVDIAVRLAAAAVAPLEAKYQVADKEAAEDE